MSKIELKERKPTWDYMLNDLAFSNLKTRALYGIFDNQDRFDFEYQIELKDKEIERLKKREQECIDHYLVQCKYASEMEDKYITANNIINELEKYIKEDEWTSVNGVIAVQLIKNKLQELKGSDKE